MARFVVLFLACLALAAARQVRRDAPAPSPWQEIEKHATEFSKTFTEQINSLANSKNTQEFNKALKDGSDTVLKQLSAFSTSLQGAVNDASGKAKEALEQSRANIQRTAEDLRKAHPEVEQQANALREKLETAVKSAVAESQKLAKEVATNMEQTNQKLAPQIKSAYDDFVKQAEAVQKKLHEVAAKQ
ncbi:apolipophorin-3 [Bicyclus anynana]|uniref:Apolipophorin-3 n=1 Tax=Bicyclus anynana TaxID=110368 RepID=A0A6J1N527_BICAN|nr:apolipophorin-3 [Bicyclus anynana]